MDQYPILRFWIGHGHAVALVATATLVVAASWAADVSRNWLFLAIGLVAAALVYLTIRGFVELVRLVTDMLVPKE